MDVSIEQVAAAGRSEAARMKGAVAGRGDAEKVSMAVDQFTKLAALIDMMAGLLDKPAHAPDPAAFGEARCWVPLEVFERKRRAMEALEQECALLRQAAPIPLPF